MELKGLRNKRCQRSQINRMVKQWEELRKTLEGFRKLWSEAGRSAFMVSELVQFQVMVSFKVKV